MFLEMWYTNHSNSGTVVYSTTMGLIGGYPGIPIVRQTRVANPGTGTIIYIYKYIDFYRVLSSDHPNMVGFPLCFSPRKILGLNHAPKGIKGKGITTWQKISEDQGNHGNSCWFYHALTMTNKAFLLKHLVVVISDFFQTKKRAKAHLTSV
jgi:hypothetical protein